MLHLSVSSLFKGNIMMFLKLSRRKIRHAKFYESFACIYFLVSE